MNNEKISHPGVVLVEEFLRPLGISQSRLARDLNIPRRRINEIVLGKRGISADTALRLAHYFGNMASWWMELQSKYNLEIAKKCLGDKLEQDVEVFEYRGKFW